MFRDLVEKNRSYRGFDESCRVTLEEMREFVDLTRFTASTVNIQPLKYRVVHEPAQVERMVGLTGWAGKLPELKLPREGMHPTGFIVICHDLRVNANPTPFLKDVGIVAQTILLAATEKGFGGCMIGSYKADALRIELGLGEELVPQLVIALGKPAEEVRIAQVGADGDTVYYRDENDVHYVPKRSLEDILL